MSKDFGARLAKFGKTFKTAKERAKEEGGFGNDLPDSKYKARLESCEINEAKSSGRLQVAFNFVVTAGEEKGEKVGKYQSIETEDDQVWLARDLRRFGIDMPDNAEDLQEVVKLLDDSKPELVISLKTKDSGQFCYIDKVTSELDAGDFKAEDDGEGEPGDGKSGEDDNASEDIEEGSEVTWKEDGDKFQGKVLSIDEDDKTAVIKDEDGDKHKDVDLDDLTLVEEKKVAKKAAKVEEGDMVSFEYKGKEYTGKVKSIDEDKDLAIVKDEDGEKHTVDLDDLTKVDEDAGNKKSSKKEEEATVEIGMKVEFKNKKGKTLTGKVSKILEADNAVVVKDKEGEKYTVSVDDLSIPE